jgi:hypothetical protein
MFKWIVCARRPLVVDEIREAIAFTLEDSQWDKDKIPTDISRLARGCGNLIIIDEETKVVRLAHYTVQQYLLQEDNVEEKSFNFALEEANNMVGETCVAYLNFSDFETQLTRYKSNAYTDMAAITKVALKSPLIAPDGLGQSVVKLWETTRTERRRPRDINYARHLPGIRQQKQDLTKDYPLLGYITAHWLWHTISFARGHSLQESKASRLKLFRQLILQKDLLFDFTPWGNLKSSDNERSFISLIGWALMANHKLLLETIDERPYLGVGHYITKAATWLFRDYDPASNYGFKFNSLIPRDGPHIRISQFLLNPLQSFSPDSFEPEVVENIVGMEHPMFQSSNLRFHRYISLSQHFTHSHIYLSQIPMPICDRNPGISLAIFQSSGCLSARLYRRISSQQY